MFRRSKRLLSLMPRVCLLRVLSLAPGLALTALAADLELRPATGPTPEYAAHRADTPPTIDGDLSDPAWANAAGATLGFPWPEQAGPRQSTTVRLLWDDRNLYFAFDCDDGAITTKHERRDDPTYEDDAVELFLNPFPDRSEYVGLEINARGALYDYLFVHPHKLYANYDLKGIRLVARPRSAGSPGWTVEGAVPLANFVSQSDAAPVAIGTVWTMNLNRWDGTEPQRVFSIWSDSGRKTPNPHAPQRFGRLVFAR